MAGGVSIHGRVDDVTTISPTVEALLPETLRYRATLRPGFTSIQTSGCRSVHPSPQRLTELGSHPLLQHAIDVQVDLLVVERGQSGDSLALGQRRSVDPDEVVVVMAIDVEMPIGRRALVRAVRFRLRWRQEVQPHVRQGKVMARWEPGLEQDSGLMRVSDGFTVHDDPDVPGAGQDVHPGVRVAGWT